MRRSQSMALGIIASTGLAAAIAAAVDVTGARAEPPAAVWNFERVGMAALPDGRPDPQAYSKLAPWPETDGTMLYSGCYDPTPLQPAGKGRDRCFMTIDLSDPDRPRQLATVLDFDPASTPPPGHVVWKKDYPFPNLPAKASCRVDWNDPDIAGGKTAPACWDPAWNTHTHYVARGPGALLAVNQERYRYGTDRQQSYSGVKFYDISDPAHPKFLSYWGPPVSPPDAKTGVYPDMEGTHHFNFDGPYLFLGTYYQGYVGKILVILDVSDPAHPKEVSHWALPGQKTPEEDAIRDWEQARNFTTPVIRLPSGKWRKHAGMHYVTVYEGRAYLAYHQAGLVVLDVGDKAHPKFLSRTDYLVPGAEPDDPDAVQCRASAGGQPAACGNSHSARMVPGRDNLLIMTDEYFMCPFGHLRLYDVADPGRPKLLSHFLLPENVACGTPDPAKPVSPLERRGASTDLGNAWNKDLYIVAWYGAGVRAVDISDPANPKEVGRYQYRIDDEFGTRDHTAQDTYDAVFGPGDRIYVSDGTAGLRVVRYTGPHRTPTPGGR